MAHEAAVFRGDERCGHEMRQFAKGHGFATRRATVGDQASIGGKDTDIGRTFGNGPGIGRRQLRTVINNDADHCEAAPEAGNKTPPEHAHQEAAAALFLARLCGIGATTTGRLLADALVDGKAHGMTHGRLDALALCGRAGLAFATACGRIAYAIIGRNAEIHE
jgi:hypothetical protein